MLLQLEKSVMRNVKCSSQRCKGSFFTLQFGGTSLVHTRGGARHFHLEGPLEGPVLQQGELSMVCVGLSERDLLRL